MNQGLGWQDGRASMLGWLLICRASDEGRMCVWVCCAGLGGCPGAQVPGNDGFRDTSGVCHLRAEPLGR